MDRPFGAAIRCLVQIWDTLYKCLSGYVIATTQDLKWTECSMDY